MLKEDIINKLLETANKARENSYAPYSKGFTVGAAVLTEDGDIFSGCNVENISFGATLCAERIAVFKAISEGYKEIKAVAVIANDSQPIVPCGMCLQVINEFGKDADIIMANNKGDIQLSNMNELLPKSFKTGNFD